MTAKGRRHSGAQLFPGKSTRTSPNTVHITSDIDGCVRTNPPVPPFGKGGRRGDLFGKGGRRGFWGAGELTLIRNYQTAKPLRRVRRSLKSETRTQVSGESHRGRQVSREDAKIAKKSKTGMILF